MKGDKFFIDSNIWLYAFSIRPEAVAKKSIASWVLSGHRKVVTSQVVNEVAYNLKRKHRFSEASILNAVEIIMQKCDLVPIDLHTHRVASRLRQRYSLSFWDSLIVEAALVSGASKLVSEDMQPGWVVDDRQEIVNPFR